jgi:hypothetical protein
VNAIVNFGERALKVPIEFQAIVFVFLEALEFFKEVEFEFGA